MENKNMENKKLLRSADNKKLCGVCGGLAEYFNLDPNVVRLAAAVITLFSFGGALWLYLIAALIIPSK